MSFWIKGSAVRTKAATTVIQDQDLPLIFYLKDIPSNYHNLQKGFVKNHKYQSIIFGITK